MQGTILRTRRLAPFEAVLVLTLSLLGPPVLAQAPQITPSHPYQALARLTPGTPVRISRDLTLVQGTLRRLTSHDVVLAVNRAEHTLSLGEVDTVWVPRRGRAGKGALVGGLAGLGIGVLVGALAAPEGSDSPAAAYALVAGAGGLLGGAVLGLLAGSEARYWDRTYPQANDEQ